ncbi:MAG: sodium:solute symporter family protein, partial [Pantoea agglomerans]
VWFLMGNPFGIDNMYVALITPAIIMVIDRCIPSRQSQPQSQHNAQNSGA